MFFTPKARKWCNRKPPPLKPTLIYLHLHTYPQLLLKMVLFCGKCVFVRRHTVTVSWIYVQTKNNLIWDTWLALHSQSWVGKWFLSSWRNTSRKVFSTDTKPEESPNEQYQWKPVSGKRVYSCSCWGNLLSHFRHCLLVFYYFTCGVIETKCWNDRLLLYVVSVSSYFSVVVYKN